MGAGPVGLVSAYKLLENGFEVDIYEKLDRVGGMCRSWDWNGHVVDVGPHIFHTPDKKLAEYWEVEFGSLFLKGDFFCKVIKGDNFEQSYDYPFSWESLTKFPQTIRENVVKDLNNLSAEKKARASNYKEYMDAQVGPTLRGLFYEKYPQKLWGIDVNKLTADWAPKRIKFREKIGPFYVNEWTAVGRKGTGAIYNNIAEKIKKLGGRIHLNTTITGIKTSGKTISEIALGKEASVKLNAEDIVISSLPITLTAKFLGHESALKFRGVRLAYVEYPKDRVLPDDASWLYYDSEKVFFTRITESKTMSHEVSPRGKTFLTVEVPYSPGDEMDRMPDADFLEKIKEQIELVGLAKKSEALGTMSHKEPFVYPFQYAGYQEELIRTRAALNQYYQLYSLGTGGDFNYADSQILFHMAFDTVANICDKGAGYSQVIREIKPVIPNKTVQVGSHTIGDGHPAFIIAEAGMNHNGSVEVAKQLIDEAVLSGCHSIKFQTFSKGSRVSKKVKAAKYAEKADGVQEDISEMFDRLSMSYEDTTEIFNYAKSKGILIFSTPFDIEAVDFLEKWNVPMYKIASMDLVNIPLIRKVAKTQKPMILSTGMSSLAHVEEAIETICKEGNPNIILLHCNSSYPAAENEMNLKAILTMKQAFNLPVGLSDHTFGLFVSHTALAIGANMIERHFTLNRTMEGPDHILSSEPAEITELVQMTKRIPAVLGDGVKRIQPNEYITLNTQRKSLFAKRTISEGEVLTTENVTVKGPGGGILPKYMDIVLGRKARRAVEEDYPISWDDV